MCVCAHTHSHTFGWCLDVPSVPGLHLWESGAGGELENTRGSSRRREREGGLLMHEGRGEQSSRAELCRGGMQIVSMCGEDRGAELAAGRCG